MPFDEKADVYIVNTCSVTAVSDKKSRQMLRRCRKLNPEAVVAACGCYVQTHPEEAASLDIDLVAGTGDRMAFLELLDEKPLNKISVRDIVERCGINRNSFYYHFQDIPSLLGEIIVERTNELMAQYPTVDRIEEAFRASIDYAQKNRRAIMHVYNSVSRDTFEASVMRLCAYMTEQYLKFAYPDTGISDADRELLHRFIKCQLFGLCIDWMLGGMKPDTGEKMGRILELYRGVAELILENCRASNA